MKTVNVSGTAHTLSIVTTSVKLDGTTETDNRQYDDYLEFKDLNLAEYTEKVVGIMEMLNDWVKQDETSTDTAEDGRDPDIVSITYELKIDDYESYTVTAHIPQD